MVQLAFLGAGRMASAMVVGLLDRKVYEPGEIACIGGPDDDTAATLARETGIQEAKTPADLLATARTLVLACKPQQLDTLDPAYTTLTGDRLILSILAGTPTSKLRTAFPQARLVARAMPNTPGQIGAGISGLAFEKAPEDADRTTATTLLAALGYVIEVEESKLHAVTAISGSGPAYVFEFTAALRDAGKKLGLDADQAATFALETVLGAARLLKQTGTDPETLRDRVTSPGGTTLAGLEALQARDFRGTLEACVQAACHRSRELAGEA